MRVELGEHERRLRLKGEGFFEVAPDKSRSSLVEVDGVRVTAVGTRFNVDQRSAPDARILSQSVDRHLDGQLDPVEALAASPALDPPTDLAFFREVAIFSFLTTKAETLFGLHGARLAL